MCFCAPVGGAASHHVSLGGRQKRQKQSVKGMLVYCLCADVWDCGENLPVEVVCEGI